MPLFNTIPAQAHSDLPEELNGYPVIESKQHRNCHTVMVRKPHGELVVATWWAELGKTWSWGHYCFDNQEANKAFAEASARNEKR